MPKTQAQRRRETVKRDRADHEACMQREGGICQRCGSTATQTHHGRTKRPDLRHDPRHHVAVCYDCHIWFHQHPSDARAWLESRGMW